MLRGIEENNKLSISDFRMKFEFERPRLRIGPTLLTSITVTCGMKKKTDLLDMTSTVPIALHSPHAEGVAQPLVGHVRA